MEGARTLIRRENGVNQNTRFNTSTSSLSRKEGKRV
jgi:hypothetical protein